MIPDDHPRAESLRTRDRLVEGWRSGIVSTHGLVAHGRGEAFDYVLGEETLDAVEASERAAAAALKRGKAVISVNGNSAALAPRELVELSEEVGAPLEVNLFHRDVERMERIAAHLGDHGAETVLGLEGDAEIPGLDHGRGVVDRDGIFGADVVLVPLEDGDRTEALVGMGKTVVAIDLNPLSRTALSADVTVVDELTRAVPKITNYAKGIEEGEAGEVVEGYDNGACLSRVLRTIRNRIGELANEES